MMKTFLGHCYATQSREEFHVVAAVYCEDRNDFEAQVAHALAQQGYQFFWSEDVLPALEWVARYPAAGGAVLARSVSEVQTVALGPMVRQASSTNPPEAEQHWLEVDELGPITPLDSQFGVDPKKSVPDALQEVMFGQPEPTEAEQAEWGDAVPSMLTYAVLDAAKMPYLLTSLLESSGLRFQSLFQGDAQEELAEHAPYLVELVDDNDFTQRLFTGPQGIGGLWEKELGIFIRSRVGFDALRKHLRKFTKVQDEEGKWFYFRFWENPYTHLFFGKASAETGWMMSVQDQMLSVVYFKDSIVLHARPSHPLDRPVHRSKPTQEWVIGLTQEAHMLAFLNKIIDALVVPHPKHGQLEREQAQELVKTLIAQAQSYGLSSEYALSAYVSVALELSQFPASNGYYRNLLESGKHPDTKAELMLKSIESVKGNPHE